MDDAVTCLLAACESEAEKQFVSGIHEWCAENSCALVLFDGRVYLDQQSRRWRLIPQHTVTTAWGERYRIDFFIVPEFSRVMRWKGYAIEIDGHAWHERTHAEAAAQRRRDRELAKEGIYTIRFAAIEVFDHAAEVASELEAALEAMVIADHNFALDHTRAVGVA